MYFYYCTHGCVCQLDIKENDDDDDDDDVIPQENSNVRSKTELMMMTNSRETCTGSLSKSTCTSFLQWKQHTCIVFRTRNWQTRNQNCTRGLIGQNVVKASCTITRMNLRQNLIHETCMRNLCKFLVQVSQWLCVISFSQEHTCTKRKIKEWKNEYLPGRTGHSPQQSVDNLSGNFFYSLSFTIPFFALYYHRLFYTFLHNELKINIQKRKLMILKIR